MNPMLIGALIGAGMGAAQYPAKKRQAAEQRYLNSEAMRYSPWTGMTPKELYTPDPNLIGDMVQGGLSGAAFGQSDSFKKKEDPTGKSTPSTTTTNKNEYSKPFAPPSLDAIYPSEASLQLGPGGMDSLYARSKINPWLYMRA